jgi:hypothetical protein
MHVRGTALIVVKKMLKEKESPGESIADEALIEEISA